MTCSPLWRPLRIWEMGRTEAAPSLSSGDMGGRSGNTSVRSGEGIRPPYCVSKSRMGCLSCLSGDLWELLLKDDMLRGGTVGWRDGGTNAEKSDWEVP